MFSQPGMTAICGERGVGKSLELAIRLKQFRDAGFFVVSNMSHSHVNLDLSNYSPDDYLDFIFELLQFKDYGHEMFQVHPSFWHTGIYIGTDEATLIFGPEQQKRMQVKDPQKYDRFLSMLAQQRKYAITHDIVVQSPAKVAKDLRRYVDEHIRLAWVFEGRKHIELPHPTMPISRLEVRNIFDFIWEEHHILDPDNPVFNLAKMDDGSWAEWSTLKNRRLRLTGKWCTQYYRMFNSYQPISVERDFKNPPEFRFLDHVHIVEDGFAFERLPTFKRLFNKLGLNIRIKDLVLPTKFLPEQLFVPPSTEYRPVISEVQTQKVLKLSRQDLLKAFAKAYEGRRPASEAAAAAPHALLVGQSNAAPEGEREARSDSDVRP